MNNYSSIRGLACGGGGGKELKMEKSGVYVVGGKNYDLSQDVWYMNINSYTEVKGCNRVLGVIASRVRVKSGYLRSVDCHKLYINLSRAWGLWKEVV